MLLATCCSVLCVIVYTVLCNILSQALHRCRRAHGAFGHCPVKCEGRSLLVTLVILEGFKRQRNVREQLASAHLQMPRLISLPTERKF